MHKKYICKKMCFVTNFMRDVPMKNATTKSDSLAID